MAKAHRNAPPRRQQPRQSPTTSAKRKHKKATKASPKLKKPLHPKQKRVRRPFPKLTKRMLDAVDPLVMKQHFVFQALEQLHTQNYPRVVDEVQKAMERVLGMPFAEALEILRPHFELYLRLSPRGEQLTRKTKRATESRIPGPISYLMTLVYENLRDTYGRATAVRELNGMCQLLTARPLGRKGRVSDQDLGTMRFLHLSGRSYSRIAELSEGRYTASQVREHIRQHYTRHSSSVGDDDRPKSP